MWRGKIVCMVASALILALGLVAQVRAEDQPANNRADRMAQFREAATTRMKTALGVTDEEWKVLQPKVEKVQTLSRQMRGGGMTMGRTGTGGRRGGPQPAEGAAAQPQTDIQKASAELQKVIENKDSKPEDVTAALTAYRAAQTKSEEELAKAQKDLKEVLTPRQEAQLVLMGLLK